MTTQKAAMEQALEQLESVLCDPAGNVCWHGSYADRDIIGDALDVFRAALVEPAQEPVAGWKLVPVLPTIKMRTAGSEAATPALYSPMVVYAAMLNAAPQPPAPAVESDDLTIAYMAGYHAAEKAPAVELTDTLIEALDWCVAEINRDTPASRNARAAIAAHEKKRGVV